MGLKHLAPATATTGFFQDSPRLKNVYEDDVALRRALANNLPAAIAADRKFENDMRRFARVCTTRQVSAWVEDAEANLPKVETHTAFGRSRNELKTSEGWKRLNQLGTAEGLVAIGHEGEYGPFSRVVQFGKYYLFAPNAAVTTCPFAMTDGAARLMSLHSSYSHPQQELFATAFEKLTSRGTHGNESWSSGQWMTERPGGSDVSQSETVADYDPVPGDHGPWVINGFKWFSSATDADVTVLLARTTTMPDKLSAFFAPLRKKVKTRYGEDWEWNGVRIQRLKNKLGTRAVPTAELELVNMRGFILGKEGEGIKVISTILNITRVHNTVNAVAFARRGLAVAKAFAEVRMVDRQTPLWKNPLHLSVLARLEVQSRAMVQLAFFVTVLLGLDETLAEPGMHPTLFIPTSTPDAAHSLFRVLTPLAKALTGKHAVATLQECMESLGGVGYLENEEHHNLNIARLFRDANVLSIWEGTTNVLVLDLLRALMGKRRDGLKAMNDFIEGNLGVPGARANTGEGISFKLRDEKKQAEIRHILDGCKVRLWKSWEALVTRLESHSQEEITAAGRTVMSWIGYIVCGVLLVVDARRDGDLSAVDVVHRWVVEGVGREGWGGGVVEEKDTWNRSFRAEMDARLVFGRGLGRPKL